MQRIALDSLMEYARCPLLYWWRRRARVEPPPTAEALPERAVRQGLARYYAGQASSALDGVVSIWQEWLAEWQCPPEAMEQLRPYVEAKATIGAPLPSTSERSQEARPVDLARVLERALHEAPLVRASEYGPLSALDDSVLMALRYAGPKQEPDGSARVGVPFEVPLTGGILVDGQADLAVMSNGSVTAAEIHDYGACQPPATALSRHMGVIALFHAQGDRWEGRQPAVTCRHMRTGFSSQVGEAKSCERLLPVIAAALRGVQCGVYLPRLAVAEPECLHCAYYGLCVTQDGLDVLDDLDATLVGLGRSSGERREKIERRTR